MLLDALVEPTNMLDLKAILWLEDYLQVMSFYYASSSTESLGKYNELYYC